MTTIRSGARKVAPVQTRPAKSEAVAGKATITATKTRFVRKGVKEELGTNAESVPLESREFDPARMGHVRVAAGMTINLDNFESMRVDVAVQLPCSDDEEDVIATKDRASSLVEQFLTEEEEKYVRN